MTTIAIIGDSACARELIKNIRKCRNTKFSGQFIPENLPQIIENVLEIPEFLFLADVVLDYTGHPDTPYVLKNAKKVITTTKCKLKNAKCVECFCSADISEDFGIPRFNIKIENGRIENIEVVVSSPCGAAYFLAEKLHGLTTEEALKNAGLLAQYMCKGRGGPRSSIHKAGEIHMKAFENAVKQAQGRLSLPKN